MREDTRFFIRIGTLTSIVLAGLFILLVSTKLGAQLSFNMAKLWLPGHLQAEKISGRLFGELHIKQLRYQHQQAGIRIKQVDFDWQPLDLLRGRINIKALQLQDIHFAHSNQYIPIPKLVTITETLKLQGKIPWLGKQKINFSVHHIGQKKNRANAELHLTGPYSAMKIKGYAGTPKLAQITGQLEKPYGKKNLKLQLHLTADKGTLEHRTEIQWSPHWEWKTHSKAQRFSINAFFPKWPGLVSFVLQDQGRYQDKKLQHQLQLTDLSGHIQQLPLSGHIDMTTEDNIINVKPSILKVGGNQLQVSGKHRHQFDWLINIDDLHLFFTTAHGAIKLTGKWRDNKNQQVLTIDTSANNITYDALHAKQFQWHSEWRPTETDLKFKMKADQIRYLDYALGNSHLDAHIYRASHSDDSVWYADYQSAHHPGQAILTFNQKKRTGQLSIRQEKINLEKLENELTNFSLDATLAKQLFKLNARVQSKTGPLHIQGQINTRNTPWLGKFSLQGEHFQLSNSKRYYLTLSPQLEISSEAKHITTRGRLIIPEAKIIPPDFAESLELPREVRFVKHQHSKQDNPFAFTMDLQLRLGEKVYVSYEGLSAFLRGELHIEDKPEQIATARGELTIDKGRFSAYGRTLNIDSGNLLFSGNALDNPGLHFRASRKVTVSENYAPSDTNRLAQANMQFASTREMTVGINVDGTLEAPDIDLFSIPSGIPQADILSYLILGRPMSQVSTDGASLLFNAMSSINLGQDESGQLYQQIKHGAELDDIHIESQSTYDPSTEEYQDDTKLVLGKALSSRLYVNYNLGLFTSDQLLQFRYLLNKNWMLQTETNGVASSLDVLYNIERD